MITCQDARQLFDRYLDGELSPSLQAELHAHQLSCNVCQSELAMLEACGDVIMLDRCEPKLDDSFTDRVLLARRVQSARSPRRWNRVALLVASPLAAAASIALAMVLTMSSTSPGPKPAVLGAPGDGAVVVAPKSVRDMLTTAVLTPEAKKEMERLPEMPATGFMESLLSTVVEKTQETRDGAHKSLDELELLLRQALTDTNEKLASGAAFADDQTSVYENTTDSPAPDSPFLYLPEMAPGQPAEVTERELLDPI